MKQLFTLFIICSFSTIYCQTELDEIAKKYAKRTYPELLECLTYPNDAHHPEDIEQNVWWSEKAFKKRGFLVQRLETETVPMLLAERKIKDKNAKTVLVYLQMDGQPVDSKHWFQEDPFKPVLKKEVEAQGWVDIPMESLEKKWDDDWRIFARSTSDAKGPVLMFLAAMDAMNSLNKLPNYNLKVIIDFEEEMGSPHLPAAVEVYKKELSADYFVIFDGPPHITNQPTLSFGARGMSRITLKVLGPQFPQHSGHYGNYCPNPALKLAQLLASMKDESGRVTISGFYDGIELGEKTKKMLAAVPDDENYINTKLGIAAADKVGANLQEALQYPSLNVRGMGAAWIGDEVRTIIPSSATAEIDVRLVVESDPERLMNLVKNHIESKGYLVLDRQPTARERLTHPNICQFNYSVSYKAFRTEIDSEIGIWLSKAMVKAFGKEPVKIRTLGGSIPISPFVSTLGVPAVAVPTVNPDNNQHSPNENIRLGNYVDGIKTIFAILTERL